MTKMHSLITISFLFFSFDVKAFDPSKLGDVLNEGVNILKKLEESNDTSQKNSQKEPIPQSKNNDSSQIKPEVKNDSPSVSLENVDCTSKPVDGAISMYTPLSKKEQEGKKFTFMSNVGPFSIDYGKMEFSYIYTDKNAAEKNSVPYNKIQTKKMKWLGQTKIVEFFRNKSKCLVTDGVWQAEGDDRPFPLFKRANSDGFFGAGGEFKNGELILGQENENCVINGECGFDDFFEYEIVSKNSSDLSGYVVKSAKDYAATDKWYPYDNFYMNEYAMYQVPPMTLGFSQSERASLELCEVLNCLVEASEVSKKDWSYEDKLTETKNLCQKQVVECGIYKTKYKVKEYQTMFDMILSGKIPGKEIGPRNDYLLETRGKCIKNINNLPPSKRPNHNNEVYPKNWGADTAKKFDGGLNELWCRKQILERKFK